MARKFNISLDVTGEAEVSDAATASHVKSMIDDVLANIRSRYPSLALQLDGWHIECATDPSDVSEQ